MHVGEPVLHVETAQEISIGLDTVGVVDIAGFKKPEPPGFGGLDDPLQTRFGKFAVADERDALDACLGAFPDLENKIDAPFAAADRVGRDLHLVAAIAVINLDDPRHVLTHGSLGHRTARLQADLLGEILVLDLLVALEPQALDQRRFDHSDDEVCPGPSNFHILE